VNFDEKANCGRPLGMAFDTISDSLIVMHSFEGIFQIDLKTGKKKQLVSEKEIVGDDVRR
jgi:adipocyte plasma membrane-associated protein